LPRPQQRHLSPFSTGLPVKSIKQLYKLTKPFYNSEPFLRLARNVLLLITPPSLLRLLKLCAAPAAAAAAKSVAAMSAAAAAAGASHSGNKCF
jgi:hypothetical protein